MKNRLSSALTWVVAAALVIGAVCIGATKAYRDDREELLISCMQRHASARDMRSSIAECSEDVQEFDAKLKHRVFGRIAGTFGVEPIGEDVAALHAQLIREDDVQEQSVSLTSQIGEMLEDTIDTKLSFGKILWTMILLSAIFGKKGRKKGVTLGKLLAGFGLFKLWRRD